MALLRDCYSGKLYRVKPGTKVAGVAPATAEGDPEPYRVKRKKEAREVKLTKEDLVPGTFVWILDTEAAKTEEGWEVRPTWVCGQLSLDGLWTLLSKCPKCLDPEDPMPKEGNP